jgi:hypothetical protein
MRMGYPSRIAALIGVVAATAGAQSFPATGLDEFNILLGASLFDDPACTVSAANWASPHGVIRIKRGAPVDPGDGRREVALEIVSMSLAGDLGVSLLQEAPGGSAPDNAGDPPCVTGGAAADGGSGCSPGRIKSMQTSVDFPAEVSLDLFLEVTVGGTTFFNKTALSIVEADTLASLPWGPSSSLTDYFEGSLLECIPLYDVSDPFGPAVKSIRAGRLYAGDTTAAPFTASKLVLVDRAGTADDRMLFVSKDTGVSVHSGYAEDTGFRFSVAYGATSGSYTVPPGTYDGGVGWTVSFTPALKARYRNGEAPAGQTQVRILRIRQDGPLKVGARGVGDIPIDILGAGAPSGPVSVVAHVTGGESRRTLCTEFASCAYTAFAGGSGAKLVCKDGTPAPTCTPME